MTITTTAIQLTQDGKTIYMLYWGDYEDKVALGPYMGQSGLDFYALTNDYRRDRYAEKEAAMEDDCSLSEDDFVDWLLEKGMLQVIESTGIVVQLSSSYGNAYVPKHWPECPECAQGRGELEYGEVRRSLNRVVTLHRCTECRHEWGHSEIANDETKPMLDDDGRGTTGGCVPFSISKACGLSFDTVMDVCEKYGWNRANGMFSSKAVVAARELGYELIRLEQFGANTPTPPTLKQLTAGLPLDRSYVLGVKNHWLAFVNGRIVDNDTATGMACRVIEIYEVRKLQALAA